MNNLRITEKAAEHLNEIKTYITETLKNPTAARKLLETIYNDLETVCEFPKSCPHCSLLEELKDYRILNVKNFRIFYSHKIDTIYVEAVIYNKRLIKKEMF